MKQYYTYLWLREDGSPYYVGKGTGYRAFRKGSPKDHSRICIIPQPTEEIAFLWEKVFIFRYGRKDKGTGILRNLTDGGENPPIGSMKGHRHSLESKSRMSAAKKGYSPWIKGKKHPAETRSLISLKKKGNRDRAGTTTSDKARANMSAGQKNRWKNISEEQKVIHREKGRLNALKRWHPELK